LRLGTIMVTSPGFPFGVIGSRSHSGVLRFLLGSTAEAYLRTTTTTDILVVSLSATG
jgi:hypothetical protein